MNKYLPLIIIVAIAVASFFALIYTTAQILAYQTGDGVVFSGALAELQNQVKALKEQQAQAIDYLDQDYKTEDLTQSWQVFQKDDLGFKFKYPADYEVIKSSYFDNAYTIVPVSSFGADPMMYPEDLFVTFSVTDNPEKYPVKDWYFRNSQPMIRPGCTLYSIDEAELPAGTALRNINDCSTVWDADGAYTQFIYLGNGQKIYSFYVLTRNFDQFKTNQNIFRNILDSFEFIN